MNNNKYIKYINYIANDIEIPYLKSLDAYGLKQDEIELVLNKVFNQTIRFDNEGVLKIADDGSIITISDKRVYNQQGNLIYQGTSDGYWQKNEYDEQGNRIYYEDDDSRWYRKEYNEQGKRIYFENSNCIIIDNR